MTTNDLFDFSSFPKLETERLNLRELSLSDVDDIAVITSDHSVMRFNGHVTNSEAEVIASICDDLSGYPKKRSIFWAMALKETDTVIGTFCLNNWSQYHRRAEIGYGMARVYWGKGYASETMEALLHFAFTRMNLNYLYAGTIAENHESVRLLERHNFVREGTRRSFSWEDDGTFKDGAMYSMLQSEFQSRLT